MFPSLINCPILSQLQSIYPEYTLCRLNHKERSASDDKNIDPTKKVNAFAPSIPHLSVTSQQTHEIWKINVQTIHSDIRACSP